MATADARQSELATLLRPGQSVELLKALHILTRDGKLNQDSRRKLKQVFHLCGFIEPLIRQTLADSGTLSLVDHGAGKSYLGFLLYDLYLKDRQGAVLHSVETRPELNRNARALAAELNFERMSFHALSVQDSIDHADLPQKVDIVTALHACDTATDEAIRFALAKHARHIVLVPCCQAEVATELRKNKGRLFGTTDLVELFRHPLHTREFGSQLTNVLRCLLLESHGYAVTVTELVGWEHSMKNELIVATRKHGRRGDAQARQTALLTTFGLESLHSRFVY